MPDEMDIPDYLRQWMLSLGGLYRNPDYEAGLEHELLQESLRILSLRITCERTG